MSQTLQTTGRIRSLEPAPADAAAAHFAHRLTVETDCSDVDHDLRAGARDIVVIDARTPEVFGEGHVPGAVNLPFREIDGESAAAVLREGVGDTSSEPSGCSGDDGDRHGRLLSIGSPNKASLSL